MNVKIKVTIAVLLIISAAGVVGINTYQFVAPGGTTDGSADGNETWGMEPGVSEEAGLQIDEVRREKTSPGTNPKSKESENPLGTAWNDTVWENLVNSYVNRPQNESVPAGITTPVAPETTVSSRPSNSGGGELIDGVNRYRAASEGDELESALERFALRGILHNDGCSSALINGWIFHSGDTLPGGKIRISAITRGYVLLEQVSGNGRVLEKRLEPLGVRRFHNTAGENGDAASSPAQTNNPTEPQPEGEVLPEG